ncbi:7TM diverse intracellular signaling domain-containing protein [Aliarcobacter cryaerophilus]|uniref:7TM diverse intracellular signaling domain-containing protein n=1 Tax=Aliarcobacter cryaerophilus TaxID=28198 RepID=UPI000EF2E4A1|nr:7TM diverse intracellular signaling domain-containing protein [Aliarcobacter cryaerophilus]AYJ78343.1 7TMR-DISM-7TM/7TMR-DISMED2 domain-containing two-component system sensor histidine kinase [Aliarcobacter cryaerophilus D2610]
MKYLISIFLFINFLYANSSTLVLENGFSFNENFEISYLKDSSNELNIQEIANSNDFQKHSNKFSLGYLKDTIWIKVDLKNKSSKEDFILSLNEHFYEKANMHYFDKSENLWKTLKNGVFTPIKERNIETSKLAFNFKIQQNSSQTIFVELKAKYPYFGNIAVYSKDYFFASRILNIDSFFILQFGILLIIIIFNLFLWLSLKEKVYIYYVGYAFFALVYLINISGLLIYFDLQHYMYKLHFSVSLCIIFLSLFSIEYFEAKRYFKASVFVIKILILLLFVFAFMMVAVSYSPWNNYMNHIITIILITLIVSSIKIYKKGQYFLKYYIFAISIYFTSVIIFILFLMGIIEYNYFNRYAYIYCLSLEIIVFALILSNRYNIIKNEQIKTQNELISLQINQNKLLENEVEKKTLKLTKLVKERELLVKEVFHRVKNNFHVITAFLWFESKKDDNKHRFTELINRIKSMSLLHEYLCNSKDLIDINLKEYIDELVKTIIQTYSIPTLKINTNIENINLEFENIMSLGVVVNEIISNSIKHHPKEKAIILDINCYKKSDSVILIIVDNGLGFDENIQKTGLGLELIKDFINKLPNAKYSFYKENGTVFELSFKDINNEN